MKASDPWLDFRRWSDHRQAQGNSKTLRNIVLLHPHFDTQGLTILNCYPKETPHSNPQMNRRLISGSDDTTATLTPSLIEDADIAARVLGSLCHDDEPQRILHKMLSIRSVVSTASSFATRQQQARIFEELQSYRPIGQGTCGTVFEHTGFAHVVKREHDGVSELWNDLNMHSRVLKAFKNASIMINVRVPTCHGFVSRNDSAWWSLNQHQFPKAFQAPGNLIVAERIHPLPRMVRNALIDLYFPPSQPRSRKEEAKKSSTNKDCLARVYLGKRRYPNRRPSQFFTLVNFNLHLDQMEELQLETEAFAVEMANTLALLHWVAKIDADDVEFVLGSAPTQMHSQVPDPEELTNLPVNSTTIGPVDFQRRAVHIWLLDFNKCNLMSMDEKGTDNAVKAFFKNDPYYPRPPGDNARDQQLWKVFRDSYLTASQKFGQTGLAQMFIEKVIETVQVQREARGNGFTARSANQEGE